MNARARRRSGLTLLELLLVMAILSTVMGLGLGMFASLDYAKRQALGLVKNELRAAQNCAIARRAPASVRFDVASRSMQPRFQRVVGTWHFEDEQLSGAFGHAGRMSEARLVERGWIGKAIDFDTEAGGRAELPLLGDSANDFQAGFALELALRRGGAQAADVLNAGNAFGLQVLRDGALRAWFTPVAQDQLGTPVRGQHVVAQSEPGALPAGVWTRVRLDYDQREFVLSVDGRAAARVPESAAVWAIDGSLLLSSASAPFRGAIDDLALSATERVEDVVLPRGVSFAPDVPVEVVFQAGGGLDRRLHSDALRIAIDYEDGSRAHVLVGLYGTVE